jgi:rhomboid protease GluP
VPAQGYRHFAIRLAPPTLTYVFIGACLAAFFLEIGYGFWRYNTWTGSQNTTVLIDLGAKVNQYILLGEWWRLFTAMFLHIGVMHLLFNMWALFAIGRLVEAYYGHARYAIIYLLGGLFGSLASYAFSPSVSAGASGAVFALTGATSVYFFRYRDNFGSHGRAVLQNMVFIIVINLAFGLAGSGVDNWGHIGGLVGGLLLAWGLLPQYAPPQSLLDGNAPLLSTADLMDPERVQRPLYMELRARTGAEAAWVLLVVLLFAAGMYGATLINISRYPGLVG